MAPFTIDAVRCRAFRQPDRSLYGHFAHSFHCPQKGTWVVSSPQGWLPSRPGRPDRIRQKLAASITISSPPVPQLQLPPAGASTPAVGSRSNRRTTCVSADFRRLTGADTAAMIFSGRANASPINVESHAGESITGDLMSKAW
ncbi:MAG: hypothetical protein K0R61_5447 [Microvirga sp.]|nr:hypothetical protein [Microvirga sp.]